RNQKLTDRAREIIALFRDKYPEYQASLSGESSFEEKIGTLKAIRKGLPGNLPNVLKERLTLIHSMLEGISQGLLDRECLKRLPVLGTLLEGIDHEYTRAKLEKGLVDFTDQQVLVRRLLLDYPDLAARVRQGIKYLLVDEFQDTNGLQMELIGQLTGENYQGGRLMAVGDVKQSIYRFRGAEAELITELGNGVRSKGGAVIELFQNYRSDRVVIDFINQIAIRLFEGEGFDYQPLQATRTGPDSGIEFLLTGAADRMIEAKMVAGRIAQMVRENPSPNNPVNYGDIVLLFRAGSSVRLYQQAFQSMGIPYYNSCGGDFYHRQEIVDQLNLLRLVQQRFDSLALLALLTSPYVGLSETGLFWLGRNGDLVREFYEGEFPEEIAPAEQERLRKFRGLINYLFQNREMLEIPDILRTALERCHYQEMLWASPHGPQGVANLEKLLAKADEFVAKGFHDLNRFLAYIAELEGMGILEGEAPTAAELGNVVRLMTIHRSKGLEFPVVIIPELDRQFNFRNHGNLVFHKDSGLGMNIPLEDEVTAESSLWVEIKQKNRREEISELKRLLYVAMTRAKQRLVMVGSGCSSSRGNTLETANSWMRWFELLMPLNEAGAGFDYHGVPVKLVRNLPEAPAPVRPKIVLEQLLPEIRTEPQAEQTGLEVAVTVEAKPETLRVSEILTYLNCPRRYFWQYRMRLKSPVAEFSRSDPSDFKDNLGALIGDFLHQAAGREDDSWPEELWEGVFAAESGRDKAAVKEAVIRIWRNFRKSPYTERSGKRWDEVPFLLKLTPELRVEGRFDRLLQNQAGELTLVDYKTHRVPAERVNGIAISYYPQLQLYALAVKALWGRLPHRAVLYFPYPDQGVEVPLDQNSLARLVAEVERMAGFIGEHALPGDYPKCENCWKCNYEWCCK
ncbi:MAG: UvrD-helicase domain-containing protein, partial [Bacteroidota bacterium]